MFHATSRKMQVRLGAMFLLRSGCQIAGMSYKFIVGGMSLWSYLAALHHAEQTCLAGTAVRALVVVVIRRVLIINSLLNTENAQRSAADDLHLVITLARDFVMMAMTADSVYRLAR
jgi:hypothetical protein